MADRLTARQRYYAEQIFEKEYSAYNLFPWAARNRPKWKLVEMGLAEFDFGPRGSWLMTYCFMPVWSDPIC